ncbi:MULTISPECIES: conjugal transfer protein TrbE [unclassified Variovorax]|uniref:VirB4 family type IV secretion/conjugal transfer ATPase n=1 Tax=unclassified Variovorax TaxID=663243 RepID=UPI0008B33EC5|nr:MULTISPECIES: conjugal transfer protein TrbE [unclassified Variovorax]SEK16553.1 type IV secretion system protein VirB4 [Variovorax sp. OK202]SFE52451.1 type IV secretion system protein VirB4 [Variovorax sp. OK212]
MRTTTASRAERSVASCLPYSQQIDDHTVITYEGDLTQTISVQGIAFETMGHKELDNLNQQWLAAINTMARSPHVALWTHVERRRVHVDLSGLEYDNGLSREFAQQYAAKFEGERLFTNQLFVSPVYRIAANRADRLGLRLSQSGGESMVHLRRGAREDLARLSAQLVASLRRYHPRLLGTYEIDHQACSRAAQFYGRLAHHVERHVRLDACELSHKLQAGALNFGAETVEIEGASSSQLAACLTLVAPYRVEQLDVKVFDGLLAAPFEFVLSQSVTVMAFDRADALLKSQYNRIKSTSGNEEQLGEVAAARTQLQAGRFSMFDHELVLVVYGETIKELNQNINAAVTLLDQKSMSVSRERGGALICTYFSILPGNFKHGRIRAMPISSRNLSKLFPLHNHPTGNAHGSQWGAPIAVMKTVAAGPYFFNFHVSRDRLREQGVHLDYGDETVPDVDSAGGARAAGTRRTQRAHRKELGNYKIIGRSGSGKTVLKLALRLLARKRARADGKTLKVFSFDKDYGEEICIRAMEGRYFHIAAGEPTGMNPFSLPPTAENLAVILSIMSWNAQFDGKYLMSHRDEEDLLRSIRQVYQLPPHQRRYARVRDALPTHEEHSLYQALGRWCDGGAFAWVLDNAEDRFDLRGCDTFGFDMTNFLDIDEARTPILRYLTHKITLEAAGAPHIIDIAEAWRALKDPLMQRFIENKGKTIRKEDGVIGLDTQEPSDISRSPLGSTLLSQFPTQLLLPNGEADPADYIEGLKLTPREFQLIKHTEENSGQFLLKKGAESVLARLDLSGMEDMLAVLSASLDNVEVMRAVIDDVGPDAARWLPIFLERRA